MASMHMLEEDVEETYGAVELLANEAQAASIRSDLPKDTRKSKHPSPRCTDPRIKDTEGDNVDATPLFWDVHSLPPWDTSPENRPWLHRLSLPFVDDRRLRHEPLWTAAQVDHGTMLVEESLAAESGRWPRPHMC